VDEVEALVIKNWDLIEKAVRSFKKKYGFPERVRSDLESAAGIALWRAAKQWNKVGDFRSYALNYLRWRMVDEIRTLAGRSLSERERRKTITLNRRYPNDSDYIELQDLIVDEICIDPEDLMVADDRLNGLLTSLPNDRQREVVVRTLLGDTEREIAKALGVTESRISQILSNIRLHWNLELGGGELWQRHPSTEPASPTGSWR
jgi:RNA polymerase sigma factor (sigma-70 family)